MAPAPVFLHHPSSLEHDTGHHPEHAQRIVAIDAELAARDWIGFERVESAPAAREDLLRVHPESYVEAIERACARGGGHLDLDTVVSAGSYAAALHAAGGAVELVARLIDGRAPCGFTSHRPPGHHALSARAMGFCLFNTVAVAARYALGALGVERVMIVDWDVHHGNGTNDIFHGDDEVLFLSIHQSPLYPGTGSALDVGSGAGEGFTVNLPVRSGSGDDVFASLVEGVAVPLIEAYRPGLVLISAGYDAHRDDPLADCRVTESGYATMTRALLAAAESVGAPVGCVLEGGYNVDALARSVAATMEALIAGGDGWSGGGETDESREARARVARWWPQLG